MQKNWYEKSKQPKQNKRCRYYFRFVFTDKPSCSFSFIDWGRSNLGQFSPILLLRICNACNLSINWEMNHYTVIYTYFCDVRKCCQMLSDVTIQIIQIYLHCFIKQQENCIQISFHAQLNVVCTKKKDLPYRWRKIARKCDDKLAERWQLLCTTSTIVFLFAKKVFYCDFAGFIFLILIVSMISVHPENLVRDSAL